MGSIQGIEAGCGGIDRAALRAVATYGRPALAWEVLRRDPRYKETFEQVRSQSHRGRAADDAFAARWGCTFAEHPGQSCAQLLPMWSGLTDRRVLPARAKQTHDHTERLFDVSAGNARILIGQDAEHVLVEHGAATIRIDVIEGTVLNGPVTLHFDLADAARLDDQLAVIRAFRTAPTFDARHQRLANRLLALQATDLRDAGASLRGTADHVFGRGDWPGDGDHRKSRVRRLCDIGRSLIEGGPRAVFNEGTG